MATSCCSADSCCGRTRSSRPAPSTSPALGTDDGGRIIGANGWFLGGGPFFSYSASPDLKLGFAFTGNFGVPLKYDDNWVGRYYVQEATMLGLSLLPSVAYRVNDNVSVGASLNAMYGIYRNKVAINNVDPLRRRRPAVAARRDLGLGCERRRAVPAGRALAFRAHLELAGQPRLRCRGGVLEPRAGHPQCC